MKVYCIQNPKGKIIPYTADVNKDGCWTKIKWAFPSPKKRAAARKAGWKTVPMNLTREETP